MRFGLARRFGAAPRLGRLGTAFRGSHLGAPLGLGQLGAAPRLGRLGASARSAASAAAARRSASASSARRAASAASMRRSASARASLARPRGNAFGFGGSAAQLGFRGFEAEAIQIGEVGRAAVPRLDGEGRLAVPVFGRGDVGSLGGVRRLIVGVPVIGRSRAARLRRFRLAVRSASRRAAPGACSAPPAAPPGGRGCR